MTRDGRGAACDAALAGLVVEITPEPSLDEREAILAALQAMLATSVGAKERTISPWAASGRREALFREPSSGPVAWGRGRATRW
jgi:hypothetical protein